MIQGLLRSINWSDSTLLCIYVHTNIVDVLNGDIPIDLFAKVRKQLWLWQKDGTEIDMSTRPQARKLTLEFSQDRWTRECKARWNSKLIKD